jgi:GT2 family glycosyltransferase
MRQVCSIVVHHRNFPGVLDTVGDLLREGVPPEHVLIVDNSEDGFSAAAIRGHWAGAIKVLEVPNRGYGAGVNAGLGEVAALTLPFTLVMTHEVRLGEGALCELERALSTDARAAAAGPTLISPATGREWSRGGKLTRLLNIPVHVGHLAPAPQPTSGFPVTRAWLDGACVLYRSAAIWALPMSEEFFLYVEEVELHTRMRKAGWRILWVPAAMATQDSAGAPPFYLARNVQWFQRLHGNRAQQMLTVPAIIARRWLRRLIRGGPANEMRGLVEGWIAGRGLR